MKKRFVIVILAIIMLLGVIVPATFAWLNDSSLIPVGMNSYVHKSYFESGNGTGATHYSGTGSEAGCAYEIKYPVQLYYFAWLQYLGYFNQPKKNTTTIDQVYFWVSDDLDMTGWVLPPIGTEDYPFVGNFDGNGHTITNLTIQNVQTSSQTGSMTDFPVNSLSVTEIVGFFGVVGSLSAIDTVNNRGTTNAAVETKGEFVKTSGYTYSSLVNEVKNITLDGVTINTETNNALIGALAGYVNGTVSNAAVSDTDIIVDEGTGVLTFTENISDYSLVGYCTDPFKFTLNVSKVTLHAPGETQNIIYKSTQGEGAGFGGSIGMQTLFDRVYRVANPNANPTYGVMNHDYVTEETITINLHDDTREVVTTTAKANTNPYYNYGVTFSGATDYYRYYYYSTDAVGSYYILHDISDYDNGTFLCLYGKNTQYTKTVTTYTYLDEFYDGFRITDGTSYLNVTPNGNNAEISTGQNAESATIWALDNDGHLNALVEFDTTVMTYYLNANTTSGALSISTTASTVWTRSGDQNGTLSYSNGATWYLFVFDGGCFTYPAASINTISQNGIYLRAASNTTVDGTDGYNYSGWLTDGSGHIYTYYNGANRYLNSNGTDITLSNTASTVWNQNNDGTLTNGDGWYLVYSGGWKVLPTLNLASVSSGTNYLSVSGTSVVNFAGSPAYWMLDGDKLCTMIGTTTYYLRARSSGLDLVQSAANGTAFTYNGTDKTLSFTSGSTYYVIFNGTNWTVSTTAIGSGPISNGSRYLNATTTTVSAGNNANQATNWTYEMTTGKIHMTSGNTTYYLRGLLANVQTRSTTNLAVTTNENDSGTTWNYYGNNLTCSLQVDGDDVIYTLVFENNNFKLIDTSKNYFTIASTGGYYLNVSDAATPTLTYSNNNNNAVLWSFSDATVPGNNASTSTIVSTVVRGITRYLVVGNNGASLSNNDTQLQYYHYNYNNWRNYYYIRNGDGNYYLRYNSGWTSRGSRSDYDRITRTEITFSPVTVTVSGVAYQTQKATGTINADIDIVTGSTAQILTSQQQRQTYEKSVEENVRSGHSTYIPLLAEGADGDVPFGTKTSNTGYIVSGANLTSGGEVQTMSGDIRISKYPMSNISNSANGLTGSYSRTYDNRLEVITAVNYGSYNGFYRVSDDYNNGNNSINSNMSNKVANSRKINYVTLGLKRYKDCRDALSELFMNQNKIYGLHFMDAQIDKDRCVIIPEAVYDYETYYDLPVPEDCIDFYVRRRGFITVFAGTYYTDNNAFFSLHEIIRYKEDDSEVIAGTAKVNDIRYIKEISKIYKSADSADYIYEYANNGGYSSNESRGDLVFDMTWMTDPSTFLSNAVYYFEIPVNNGEFALGSVPGKTGAYLFYLDIAANAALAEDKERVTIAEKIKEENYSVDLPRGVQLVESGYSYNSTKPYEFASVELKNGFDGTYPLERTGNVISFTEDTYTELTFIGGALTAQTGSGGSARTYTYYPNGYMVRYLEHVTDRGIVTENYDHILVETIDYYDSSGTRTSRAVNVYADIENMEVESTVDEAKLDFIISFTYDPSTHANMKTRVVRASSDGGFNITFDQAVTFTANTRIDSENVHVNFGDNTASNIVSATSDKPLATNTRIAAIDLSGLSQDTRENLYYASVYGPDHSTQPAEVATYYSYYEGDNVTVTPSSIITMPSLNHVNTNQSRTLTYAVTLTPGTGVSSVKVYAKRLIESYTYSTKVINSSGDAAIDSGTITVTIDAITINNETLTTTEKEITINAS